MQPMHRIEVTEKQIFMLELIYEDLATRNINNLLTYDNFLVFFHLTGLWGVKLFHEFDEDRGRVISLEEFLFGMCKNFLIQARTAKASLDDKIQLLYSFFEGKKDEGIEYTNFTKMLYNYSREQLKQILIEDGFIPNFNNDKKIFQLNCSKQTNEKNSSGFEEAYKSLLEECNQGTFLEIKTSDYSYKIHYSNMNTLIQQFAAKIYAQHNINVDKDKLAMLSYQKFSKWIKQHKKLFRSYYSAFHTDLWSFEDGQPSYLNKIENDFSAKLENQTYKSKVYVMLTGNALMICQNKKNRNKPFKVICLEGLNITGVNSHGIEISHHCDSYKKSTFFFENEEERNKWLSILTIYQADNLYMNYEIGDVIGTGNFSIVYECKQKKTGKKYALKMIQIQKLTERAIKLIRNQSQILRIINHPQIVLYKEKIRTKTHEYLVMEYIYGQDLYQYVQKRGFLNEFESAFIIGQIIKAVMHLHKLQLLHRDLKPENIMVLFKQKKENQIFQCTTPSLRQGQRIQSIKIIDFGLSNHVSELEKLPKEEKAAGTPNYIAPEVLMGNTPTFKSDNFAIGAILYFLLRGKLPFLGKNAQKTFIKTVTGEYDMEDEHWDKISPQAKDLMVQLLAVDPDERINLEEAVNHEWFATIFEKTRQGSISVTSQNHQEREEDMKFDSLKINMARLKNGKKRKLSQENMENFLQNSPRYDRYSK